MKRQYKDDKKGSTTQSKDFELESVPRKLSKPNTTNSGIQSTSSTQVDGSTETVVRSPNAVTPSPKAVVPVTSYAGGYVQTPSSPRVLSLQLRPGHLSG